MVTILLIGGAPLEVPEITALCARHSIHVCDVPSLAAARTHARATPPDLILVAEDLKDIAQVEHVRWLRQAYARAMIVIETWRSSVPIQVRLLDAGCDYIVPTPCPLDLLLACARAAARRSGGMQTVRPTRFAIGPATIDLHASTVWRDESIFYLTRRERTLLSVLATTPELPVTRDALVQAVWREPYNPHSRKLDVTIWALRKKVECQPGDPRHLVTVPHVGYALRTLRAPATT